MFEVTENIFHVLSQMYEVRDVLISLTQLTMHMYIKYSTHHKNMQHLIVNYTFQNLGINEKKEFARLGYEHIGFSLFSLVKDIYNAMSCPGTCDKEQRLCSQQLISS